MFGVFYLIYLLIYQGDKGSRFNRIYLILSSFLAITLPIVKVPVIPLQQADSSTTLHQAIQLPEIIIGDSISMLSSGPKFTLAEGIIVLYFAGLAFFLARFLFELSVMLRYIRIFSNDSKRSGYYTLIHTKGKLPTCSFCKYLFWDDTQIFNERESSLIIKHEEGHIIQNHTFDIIYLEILRIIFWFNPIVHGYKKEMIAVHEFLADEFVLANSNAQGFIALLGQQVLGKQNLTLSNHFSKSQTVKRIKMIKSGKKKPAVLRWTVLVTIAVSMFYVFSCEQGYTLNELIAQDENLPALGDGWSYVSTESLSLEMSEKLKTLEAEYPSAEFYVAKAISGKVPLPDLFSHSEEYSFKIWFEKEKNSYYIILGKNEREIEITAEPTFEELSNQINGEEIFTVVDEQPAPVDGMQAYYEYVANNLRYPEEARNAEIEGKVFIEFVVSKDGSITNVKCIKGIGGGCDNEAIRVISTSPVWKPGKHEGKNVNVRMILPITFKLG
jgi:TonB family protein